MTFELDSHPDGYVVIHVRFTDGTSKAIGILLREHIGLFYAALQRNSLTYMEMGRLGI